MQNKRWTPEIRTELIYWLINSVQQRDPMKTALGVHSNIYERIRLLIVGSNDLLNEKYDFIMNGQAFGESEPITLVWPEE